MLKENIINNHQTYTPKLLGCKKQTVLKDHIHNNDAYVYLYIGWYIIAGLRGSTYRTICQICWNSGIYCHVFSNQRWYYYWYMYIYIYKIYIYILTSIKARHCIIFSPLAEHTQICVSNGTYMELTMDQWLFIHMHTIRSTVLNNHYHSVASGIPQYHLACVRTVGMRKLWIWHVLLNHEACESVTFNALTFFFSKYHIKYIMCHPIFKIAFTRKMSWTPRVSVTPTIIRLH